MIKLVIILLLLSGCGLKPLTEEDRKSVDQSAVVLCDYELGVEYWYNRWEGTLTPRWNRDGSLKQCPILEEYDYD
jgi:hypothetical protein